MGWILKARELAGKKLNGFSYAFDHEKTTRPSGAYTENIEGFNLRRWQVLKYISDLLVFFQI
jgi:hypothetical protein